MIASEDKFRTTVWLNFKLSGLKGFQPSSVKPFLQTDDAQAISLDIPTDELSPIGPNLEIQFHSACLRHSDWSDP